MDFDFPEMHTAACRQSQQRGFADKIDGIAYGPRGPITPCRDLGTIGLRYMPAVARQKRADQNIQMLRPFLAQTLTGGLRCKSGYHHCWEEPVELAPRPGAGQKFLRSVSDRVEIAGPGQVILPYQADKSCSRNVLGEIATGVRIDMDIVCPVQSQG